MSDELEAGADTAVIFAVAKSLLEECHRQASRSRLNLSECYLGLDNLMREVMRIGARFESWSGQHIDFDQLTDVWPYLLEDRFGSTCLKIVSVDELAGFDDADCSRIALRLGLTIRVDTEMRLPLIVEVPNPDPNAAFRAFRIQSMRYSDEYDEWMPYTLADDPADDAFGPVMYGLFGIGRDGSCERLADRENYPEILQLAKKLLPAVGFPARPTYAMDAEATEP